MKTIEISAMTLATAIESGDLFVLQRVISGTPIAFAVPPSLLLLSGQDMGEQSVDWTDSAGASHTATLASIAEKLSFFTVSDGRLCINRAMLESTPTQDGEIYDNGGYAGINHES